MNINSLGRVNVATPGTPVPLTTNRTLTASNYSFRSSPVSPAKPISADPP